MVRTYLDFERPIAELDNKIEALIASDGLKLLVIRLALILVNI